MLSNSYREGVGPLAIDTGMEAKTSSTQEQFDPASLLQDRVSKEKNKG